MFAPLYNIFFDTNKKRPRHRIGAKSYFTVPPKLSLLRGHLRSSCIADGTDGSSPSAPKWLFAPLCRWACTLPISLRPRIGKLASSTHFHIAIYFTTNHPIVNTRNDILCPVFVHFSLKDDPFSAKLMQKALSKKPPKPSHSKFSVKTPRYRRIPRCLVHFILTTTFSSPSHSLHSCKSAG